MSRNSRQLVCFVFVFFSLFLAGCDQDKGREVALVPENETIAVLNNEKIPLSVFQARFQAYLKQYDGLIPPGEKNRQAIKKLVIDQLIAEELTRQESTRKGIQVSKAELETSAEEALLPYQNANFEPELVAANLSKKQWKEKLRFMLLQKKLIEQEVNSKIMVTKREVNDYYKKHRREFIRNRSIRARNLTLATGSEADALRKLLLRGADVKDLIHRHSISPDRVNDGDLGFVTRGELPPELETALFSLNRRNRVSQVVHSQDGYHLLVYVQSKRRHRFSLSESKEQIRSILVSQQENKAYAAWLSKLKERATIGIDQKMLRTEEGF